MTTSTLDTTPPEVSLRIGEEKRLTASGGTYQHINPCTGTPDAEIPMAGAAEINEAVEGPTAPFSIGGRPIRPSGGAF